VPKFALSADDLDLISLLTEIQNKGCGEGFAFRLGMLLATLGILSRCQSLRDLEHFDISKRSVLTKALGSELRRPASDSVLRYFFRQVDVTALCASATGRSPISSCN
jgi:hypothetical protein